MLAGLIHPISGAAEGCRSVARVFALVALAAALLPMASARAAECGDDVAGRRVPCACGDIVVSDTALSATDPVVSERCSRDGLFVATPAGQHGIRLDLSGLSLVGQGIGAGIRVVRGGSEGVTIIGGTDATRAQIAGFETGIAASGSTAVREIRNVDVVANHKDGLKVRSSGLRASDVSALRNGRSGLRVTGHGARLKDVQAADNAGTGIRLHGSGATVDGVVTGNAGSGARLTGRGHDLSASEVIGNGGAGVEASGRGHAISGATIGDNAGGDVRGSAEAVK
ncbi:MAG TPA: right-handed parallel beta-helix repeat-containing protein [Candidatus Limnocylindrales bacterium]|nr:right-handed parallel beta-helix repeat-containing protein [Candidatus Limnocylindrales bacterium]